MDGSHAGDTPSEGRSSSYASPALVSYGSVAARTLAAVIGSVMDNMSGMTMMF